MVSPTADGSLARSTGAANSSGACEHGLFIDFHEKTDKLSIRKASLHSVLVEVRA